MLQSCEYDTTQQSLHTSRHSWRNLKILLNYGKRSRFCIFELLKHFSSVRQHDIAEGFNAMNKYEVLGIVGEGKCFIIIIQI